MIPWFQAIHPPSGFRSRFLIYPPLYLKISFLPFRDIFKISFPPLPPFMEGGKDTRIRISRELWPYIFLSSGIFILRGLNHEYITHEIFAQWPIHFFGQTVPWIKKLKKTYLHYFWKKGVCFFNFLIQALLRPQIAIKGRANISRIIFSWFGPLRIENRKKIIWS